MNTPNGYTNCEQVSSYYAIYQVPVAALLWCGVPAHQIQGHLDKSTEKIRGVFSNPYIPCLEVKCRVLHNMIESGVLPVCREKGVVVDDHVAPERRHIRRQDLKAWIAKEFPDDKPSFLFDEIERKTHSSINKDVYLALQADRDALKAKVISLNKKNEELLTESKALKSCMERMTTAPKEVGDREESTYLNIIGGLLALMLGKSPSGVKQSVYISQAAIISALLGHYAHKAGISPRTLDSKFADANKSIKLE